VASKLWRLFFILLLTAFSVVLGWYAAQGAAHLPFVTADNRTWVFPLYVVVFPLAGAIFGVALGREVFRQIELVGERLRDMSARDKIALIAGLVIGLVLAAVLSVPILILIENKLIAASVSVLLGVVITYLSTVATLSMKEEIRLYMPPQEKAVEEEALPKANYKILDTNVIIDGRIADIARAGFLDGPIYIPGFVLDELQHIADSADGLKRARGRRGLDILNGMQKEITLLVRSYDRMAPGHEEVDSRLVRLAKALGGSIVTNDFNLNKVAELQGVPVLNVNELANALKPVVLPGEEMQVAIVKEGKEPSQGIGYLDDGTMIVVEGGKKSLGDTVDIVVSSVLQTQAGKMIFAHMRDEEEEDFERGVRAYTRSGTRRPVRR